MRSVKLLDMSLYKGSDSRQVKAGWKIVSKLMSTPAGRSSTAFSRIVRVATYVSLGLGSDAGFIKYLAEKITTDGGLTITQAELVMAYIKANDQALMVIARLAK